MQCCTYLEYFVALLSIIFNIYNLRTIVQLCKQQTRIEKNSHLHFQSTVICYVNYWFNLSLKNIYNLNLKTCVFLFNFLLHKKLLYKNVLILLQYSLQYSYFNRVSGEGVLLHVIYFRKNNFLTSIFYIITVNCK